MGMTVYGSNSLDGVSFHWSVLSLVAVSVCGWVSEWPLCAGVMVDALWYFCDSYASEIRLPPDY